MNEIKLPSGAILKVTLSPFKVSKALYQAVMEELKELNLDPQAEVDVNFWKNLMCVGFSSKKIDSCLEECMKRVTYNDLKIDDLTFEKEEARQDYPVVCFEVLQANLIPFTKALTSQLQVIAGSLNGFLVSGQKTKMN